jgi:hypothetical protein
MIIFFGKRTIYQYYVLFHTLINDISIKRDIKKNLFLFSRDSLSDFTYLIHDYNFFNCFLNFNVT